MQSVPVFTAAAELLSLKPLKNNYYVLSLQSETLVSQARPGHYLKIRLPDQSWIKAVVMTCTKKNTIEVLAIHDFNVNSHPLISNTEIEWQGLFGKTQIPHHPPGHQELIVIAENINIAAAIFFCQQWHHLKIRASLLILLGLDGKNPFPVRPSELLVQTMPEGVIASLPLLDDWGIPSRIASAVSETGCFSGSTKALLSEYLQNAKLKNPCIITFNE